MTVKVGQSYRVKSSPLARQYGLRTGGAYAHRDDCKAWPGDVGIVTDSSYTASDGSRQVFYTLEFSRGRRVALNDDLTVRDSDADYLIRHKTKL